MNKCSAVFFISLSVLVTLIFTSTLTINHNYPTIYGKQYTSQAFVQQQFCGNKNLGQNVLCHQLGSEIVGSSNLVNIKSEGTSVGSPAVRPPVVPSPRDDVATMTVIKKVICPQYFECPSASDFVITAYGNNSMTGITFNGDPNGVSITLKPGPYSINETSTEKEVDGLRLKTIFSTDCSGEIIRGDSKVCIIVNEYSRNIVFDPAKNLSNNRGYSAFSSIAVSGENVYIVWEDDTRASLGIPEIFFIMSRDGGSTFGNVINLSNDESYSQHPQIAVSGDNVYIVWEDTFVPNPQINIVTSADGGATFGPKRIVANPTSALTYPQIAISGNDLYIVLGTGGTESLSEIYFVKSTDKGETFEEVVNLSNTHSWSRAPQIAVHGSTVYVVWQDFSDGNYEIFYRKSVDKGSTFGEILNLSNTTGSSDVPEISAHGNNMYIVWTEFTSGFSEILYVKSSDNGITFRNGANLSNSTSAHSIFPNILSDGEYVYIVWIDFEPGNSDVFFRFSGNMGETFSEITNLSNSNADSSHPQIDSFGKDLYFTWEDNSPGNYDIFFIKGM